MTRRTLGAVLALITPALTVAGADQSTQDATPLFRSRATAVSLDVSVRRRNRPVNGLSAADFEVTDNGVTQTVEQAFNNVAPIDVGVRVPSAARLDHARTGDFQCIERAGQMSRRCSDFE